MEYIRVRDKRDRILFEYHPETEKGMLTMPAGDLSLRAPQGNIDIVPGGAIRCMAGDQVTVKGLRGVHLAGMEPGGGGRPAVLSLDRDEAVLSGGKLKLTGDRGEFLIREAAYEGNKFSATVGKARMVFQKLETTAVRFIQRIGDAYRYVENANYLKAGRMRTQVMGNYQLDSGRAVIKTEEDIKIRAERIHLG